MDQTLIYHHVIHRYLTARTFPFPFPFPFPFLLGVSLLGIMGKLILSFILAANQQPLVVVEA